MMVLAPVGRLTPPYAHVEQVGRFSWKIWIETGSGRWPHPDDVWYRIGERAAWRKARRELERFMSKPHKRSFNVSA
jgi:hypothetical protein